MTDERVHPTATRELATASDAHARGHPGYPPAAVAALPSTTLVAVCGIDGDGPAR